MTPLIKLLWARAIDPNEGDSWVEQTAFMERFAQLIVLECVNATMDGSKEGDHYAMRIERHFDNGNGGILQFRGEK
jgi:hypothetical protein